MKRCILVFALISLCVPAWSQSIPLGEIVGDDRSIRDPLYGLSARYPTGWSVRGVTRWGERETTIYFGAPSFASFSTLYYRIYPTPVSLPADVESALRAEAERKAEQRTTGGLSDYANVVDSFVFNTINGFPSLSHAARFTGGGKTQCEYFVRILSPNGVAVFMLRSPLDEFDGLRPGFDTMVASTRLP